MSAEPPIRYGCVNAALVPRILQDITTEKVDEAKKHKLQDEAHGAGEPGWKLKLNAHLARKALRDGERLARKVTNDNIKWDSLLRREQGLVGEFHSQRLHARVVQANTNHGHDIARAHDLGFQPGQNMCRDVPIGVRAHLRTLQGS